MPKNERIIIPKRFKEKMRNGSDIYRLCNNVEAILDLDMYYFKEFTKHDESHINAVLKHADALIPENTLKKISAIALEVLIAAIIIHDLGMLIQRDGLKSILFGDYQDDKIEFLDRHSWKEEWLHFYREIQRYDERQLIMLFGEQIDKDINLPLDRIDDTGEKWRIYGDFLRRNHHRIAHEIAVTGFYGNKTTDIFEGMKIAKDKNLRDVIGLVARSHGMAIRETYEYIKTREYVTEHNYSKPLHVPIFYLMCIIRLADYLHAGELRAPEIRLAAQHLDSNISNNEFAWNQAIYQTMTYYVGERECDDEFDGICFAADKDYVEIIADPPNCTIYLSLEKWVKSVQREIDQCWAVLTEEYGLSYKISIHRIITNIFNEVAINKYNNKFVTRNVQLTANPRLVKLMVGPLYNDESTYGIRELLQNSIDACNERNEILVQRGKKVEESEIIFDVDTEEKKLTVIDNGIGMNLHVLADYYLVAGASYCDSQAWKNNFIDDNNKRRIVRNGRFGIGALATFLLGFVVTVTTRHMDDRLGYQFSYNIDDMKPLEIKRVKEVDIGTKITIELNDNTVRYITGALDLYKLKSGIAWNSWYYFDNPKIKYIVDNNILGFKTVPSNEDKLKGWYSYGSYFYDKICWSYVGDFNSKGTGNSLFLLNGIEVEAVNSWSCAKYGMEINRPVISVIDSNNCMQLNLLRNEVSFEPEEGFVVELYKFYIAQLMNWTGTDNGIFNETFAYNQNGFTICKHVFLKHTRERFLMIENRKSHRQLSYNVELQSLNRSYAYYSAYNIEDKMFIEQIGNHNVVTTNFRPCYKKFYVNGSSHEAMRREFYDKHYTMREEEQGVIYIREDESYCEADRKIVALLSSDIELIIEYEPTPDLMTENNVMLKLLEEYLPFERNGGWIPIDIEERRRIYPEVFDELKDYMTVSLFSRKDNLENKRL